MVMAVANYVTASSSLGKDLFPMKHSRSSNQINLLFWIFLLALVAFFGFEFTRGYLLGNKALHDIKNQIVNGVSGE